MDCDAPVDLGSTLTSTRHQWQTPIGNWCGIASIHGHRLLVWLVGWLVVVASSSKEEGRHDTNTRRFVCHDTTRRPVLVERHFIGKPFLSINRRSRIVDRCRVCARVCVCAAQLSACCPVLCLSPSVTTTISHLLAGWRRVRGGEWEPRSMHDHDALGS